MYKLNPKFIDDCLKQFWNSGILLRHNKTESIEKRICKVMNQKPIENEDYLMIRLTAAPNGIIHCDIHTMFVGFSDGSPKCEIREPSIIDPQIAKRTLNKIGKPPLIVNSIEDLTLFRPFGGNGIIRKKLIDEYWPDIYQISTCVYGGYDPGFVDIKSILPQKFAKRPSKMLKKKVKERDKNKCALCNSYNNLSLHHILCREWGGRTETKNLITLCEVCHIKLHDNPKYFCDESLYEQIGIKKYPRENNKQFMESVKCYQRLIIHALILTQNIS